MQHVDEALRVIELAHDRRLARLEADAIGAHARVIEHVDDELEEVVVGEGLRREIDVAGASHGQMRRATRERR